jgi:hypothetical protein
MRKFLVAGVILMAASQANAALIAGDIAFTSFNADEDGFSLVAFVDIGINTTVFFTDNEWNGSAIGAGGAFPLPGENYLQWNTGASVISAGSVVRFSQVDKTTLSASLGSFNRVTVAGNTNYGIANSNETIYAYLGTSATAPSTFLAAITNGNFATDGSIANTGLVQGTSAMDLNGAASYTPDYAEYTGPRSGFASFTDYKALVANTANWNVDTTNGTYTNTIPNTTAFTTVAPVPVPAAAWLLGSALLGMAGLRRRKV